MIGDESRPVSDHCVSTLFERKGSRLLLLAIAAGFAALISVAVQGFLFGVGNNVFHIPLVLRWADDPVFADDQFVQSLENFVSPVWLGIRLVATESNVESVFYLLHILTRAAALAALTGASFSLGIRGLVPAILLTFWFGMVPGLQGGTAIGAGETFLFYFSHSELTIPLTVVAITLAARRSYLSAFAILGLLANVNAFAAMWTGGALVGVVMGDNSRRDACIKSFGGLLLAGVLSLPVAVWILEAVRSDPVSGRGHEQFLREYFPAHFFLDVHSLRGVALFGTIAFAGLAAFGLLSQAGRAWRCALAALCVLVVAGMVLPYLVSSRFLLDLHLLRASGLVQVLAIVGLTVAAVSSLRRADAAGPLGGLMALGFLALPGLQGIPLAAAMLLAASNQWKGTWKFGLAGPLIVVVLMVKETWLTPILCTVTVGGVLAILVLQCRFSRWGGPNAKVSMPVVAVLIGGIAWYSYDARRSDAGAPEWNDARDAARWARESTPADALFLVPQGQVDAFSVIAFESLSHRRIWVDWKRGGAVMWKPSYYDEWSRRMGEVNSLPSLPARAAYACKNAIDYVLAGLGSRSSKARTPVRPVYKNDHFQIFNARQWCAEEELDARRSVNDTKVR